MDRKSGRKSEDLRLQFSEQLRCLDVRVDTNSAILAEFQEFFRRRAEVELEYGRSLDKLHKLFTQRAKDLKQRREHAQIMSSFMCYQQLISETQRDAKRHITLADFCSTVLCQRFAHMSETLNRVHKQCRQTHIMCQEDLLKIVQDLQTSTRTYNMYYGQFHTAQSRYRCVEAQRNKLEATLARAKLDKSRKFRLVEKELGKRAKKYEETSVKALKARNELVLCIEVLNAALQRHACNDVMCLLQCTDTVHYKCMRRAVEMANEARVYLASGILCGTEDLRKCLHVMDAASDKQKYFDSSRNPFMFARVFEFTPHKEDKFGSFILDQTILDETRLRYTSISNRLRSLRLSSDEQWKTLQTAESTLLAIVDDEYDASFADLQAMLGAIPSDGASVIDTSTSSAHSLELTNKRRHNYLETEQFYLDRMRLYISECALSLRLQTKCDVIHVAMESSCVPMLDMTPSGHTFNLSAAELCLRVQPPGDDSGVSDVSGLTDTRMRSHQWYSRTSVLDRKSRGVTGNGDSLTGAAHNFCQFGTSVCEYARATGQCIPLVVRSCVRVINRFGLHHQGIFRVSGSQVEISNFKEAFERGEDPLIGVNDVSVINSVAGVLKLYLRSMKESLFPAQYFDRFMEIASGKDISEIVAQTTDVIVSLARPVFVLMRYLFAFLNHLSEFSDENMMEPYNLAVCFGPTLLPIPPERDQVHHQELANQLIKIVIVWHETIFCPPLPSGAAVCAAPTDSQTPSGVSQPAVTAAAGDPVELVYEKYMGGPAPPVDEQQEAAGLTDDSGDLCDGVDQSEMALVSLTESSPASQHSHCATVETGDTALKDNLNMAIFGDVCQGIQAVAQYDFTARSPRELSFRHGQPLTLYSQVSSDWWRGSCRGVYGLVPDKYVHLRLRGEDMYSRNLLDRDFAAQSYSAQSSQTTLSTSQLTDTDRRSADTAELSAPLMSVKSEMKMAARAASESTVQDSRPLSSTDCKLMAQNTATTVEQSTRSTSQATPTPHACAYSSITSAITCATLPSPLTCCPATPSCSSTSQPDHRPRRWSCEEETQSWRSELSGCLGATDVKSRCALWENISGGGSVSGRRRATTHASSHKYTPDLVRDLPRDPEVVHSMQEGSSAMMEGNGCC